jgi:hypothetical protein
VAEAQGWDLLSRDFADVQRPTLIFTPKKGIGLIMIRSEPDATPRRPGTLLSGRGRSTTISVLIIDSQVDVKQLRAR